MAVTIVNELLSLIKEQTCLQKAICRQLLKSEKLAELSLKDANKQMEAITGLLSHLPKKKQQELKKIVKFIRQNPHVGMVLLFGSYARGDWVEEYADDKIHFKYQSDFDILVIVSETCGLDRQSALEQSIFKEFHENLTIHTPVSVLIHDISFVNKQLQKSQYFFSDIQKEAITLYNSGSFALKKSKKLSNHERYDLAKKDFEYWLSSAKEFEIDFKNAFARNSYIQAAFLLHQVTERLYTCILLVFTRYKPNSHKIELLRKMANALDKNLIKVFSLHTKEETDRFTLLCNAYVDARYDRNYTISRDELTILAEEVTKLTQLTERVCQEKINSFLIA